MSQQQETSQKESGLAHIALVIAAVLVVAALAFGGWYVWDKNKEDKKSTDSSSQNNSQEEQKQSEGEKYLVIKEWGVRIPLSDQISQAYYTFRSEGNFQYVELFDKAFDALNNSGGVSCGGENTHNFYVISRATPENAKIAEEEFVGSDYKQFPFTEEYLFSGLGAHQAPPYCANLNPDPYGPFQEDAIILDIADEKEHAFDAAFDGLKATN